MVQPTNQQIQFIFFRARIGPSLVLDVHIFGRRYSSSNLKNHSIAFLSLSYLGLLWLFLFFRQEARREICVVCVGREREFLDPHSPLFFRLHVAPSVPLLLSQMNHAAAGKRHAQELLETLYRELAILGIVAFILWSINVSPAVDIEVGRPQLPCPRMLSMRDYTCLSRSCSSSGESSHPHPSLGMRAAHVKGTSFLCLCVLALLFCCFLPFARPRLARCFACIHIGDMISGNA